MLCINVRAISNPEGTEDQAVQGVYQVMFNDDVEGSQAKLASIALDIFHGQISIDDLDNFEISVLDEDGYPVMLDGAHEDYSASDCGTVECISETPMYVPGSDEGLDAEALDNKYNHDGEGEHPLHTRADWRAEVAEENTLLGYWAWIENILSGD
ncbi:MAG: hypothetical protein P4L87_12480 [Formivibrio sp.]|nr:hypothetical protein [Formivibrio sp.]